MSSKLFSSFILRTAFFSLTFTSVFFRSMNLAYSAGYQMRYQSAETMGNSFASDVSGAKTASGFFNNPALIAFLGDDKYWAAEFTTLIPSGDFEGDSSYLANTGDNETSGFGGTSIMPSLYYGQKINNKFFVTATLTVPWATNSDYDTNWVGKYQAVKTYLATYNLTPSVVYAFSDKLALSAGLQLQYATGELSSMVDTGALSGNPAFAGQHDSELSFDGDHLGFGATISALFKPFEGLRLGFQYRSSIKHTLTGQQNSRGTSPVANGVLASPGGIAAGLGNNSDLEAEITIPDSLTLGASYLLNNALDLHGSLSWTKWSTFEALEVDNLDSDTTSTTELNWSDTVFVAFGADYFLSEALTVRGGLSYESGAPPDNRRTPRGVDDDRLGISFGASYAMNDKFSFHGAFTQILFVNKPTIELRDPPQTAIPGGTVDGEYTTTASLFRLGVSSKF